MNAVARTLVALLVALAVLPLGAGPASAAGNLVHGTVTIAGDTTTPIEGTFGAWRVGESSYPGWRMTNGTFSVASLTDGDYRFNVRIETMDGLSRWYKQGVPGGVPLAADADIIHVASSDIQLDWQLDQLATLSGMVKDQAGNGLAGATVSMNRLGMNRSTRTDASGAYSLGYVQPGKITLYARGPETLSGAALEITLPASGPVVQDFVLLPKGALAGTVTDATSGKPIEDVHVTAHALTGSYGGTTDADGHYSFPVDPGDFVLRYDDADFASYAGT